MLKIKKNKQIAAVQIFITKTRLFKYVETFTSKKLKNFR